MFKLTFLLIASVLLLACKTANIQASFVPNTDKDPIELAIDEAMPLLNKQFKKGGISLNDNQMYFFVYGKNKNVSLRDSCDIFQKQLGYSYIKENIIFSSLSVNAMVIDENGKYLAKANPIDFFSKRTDVYNDFNLELKMIALSQENKYIAFAKIFNCEYFHYIGYKKGSIDVYRLVDTNLVFVYSK